MTHVDGNAAPVDLFTRDLSAATATCAACGQTGPVATVMVYESVGTVLRCPACDAVLLRVVRTGTTTCLDMQGIRALRWQSAA